MTIVNPNAVETPDGDGEAESDAQILADIKALDPAARATLVESLARYHHRVPVAATGGTITSTGAQAVPPHVTDIPGEQIAVGTLGGVQASAPPPPPHPTVPPAPATAPDGTPLKTGPTTDEEKKAAW
jgi:hypothetical protein